jgi:hypothetical protein
MSFHYHPAIGNFHLQEVKRPRVVPSHERHRWANKKLQRGQATICEKCGCVRSYGRDYETRYRMPGQQLDAQERPPCTRPAAPAPPAATVCPGATRCSTTPPPLPMMPGLTTTYDEPAPYYAQNTRP